MNNLREQRLRIALAMVMKEPHPLIFSNWRQGKSHQLKSLWYETNRTRAVQNKKIHLRLKGRNKKHQINTRGGIKSKTLAVDT